MADNNEKKRTRRRFTDEFKRNAVEVVRTTGKPIAQVARELGVTETSLGRWVAQDRVDRGEREGLSSHDRARLAELERENAELRVERDLLR
jgi:transposase